MPCDSVSARSAKVGTGFAESNLAYTYLWFRALTLNLAHDLFEKPVPTFRDHALARRRKPSNAHRGHDEFRAFAAAALQFRTVAKLQILGQTNPHFVDASAVAGDRNSACAQIWIGFEECFLHLGRRHFPGDGSFQELV